jgi:serine/threonine protein kinase
VVRTNAVPFPESLFERFKLLRHLASGGGGSVYLVEDRFLEREVAIKLLRDGSNPRARARFLREASTVWRIRHANVLEVLDAGEVPEGHYLVTEFLEGSSLQELDISVPPLPLVLQLAGGLEAVHAAGVLHRDIKPSNAVLSGDGRCVLVDFGLALGEDHVRVTREGKVVGTLGFFAPEMISGGDQTPATDWYALGASLFALLERRLPYSVAEMAKMRSRPPPPLRFERTAPQAPAALIAAALLSPDPGARPASLEQLERMVEGHRPPT